MFIFRRIARLNRTFQFALVGAAAFAIGSATVAAASTAGIPVGSLFYLPMINGIASTPCSTATSTLGATTTCNAIVDSNGNLHVTGNSNVSGTVGVNNFPGDQQVHGTVGVDNLPADQQVHGNVGITNLPADQQIHGMVGINNFPSTQAVSGTVNVGNLPATQNVNIVGGAVASSAPVVTKSIPLNGTIHGTTYDPHDVTVDINLRLAYVFVVGCDVYRFSLTGGGTFDITSQGVFTFPMPVDVTTLQIINQSLFACDYKSTVLGY